MSNRPRDNWNSSIYCVGCRGNHPGTSLVVRSCICCNQCNSIWWASDSQWAGIEKRLGNSARNGYPGTRITTRYPGTRWIPGYPGMSHYPKDKKFQCIFRTRTIAISNRVHYNDFWWHEEPYYMYLLLFLFTYLLQVFSAMTPMRMWRRASLKPSTVDMLVFQSKICRRGIRQWKLNNRNWLTCCFFS